MKGQHVSLLNITVALLIIYLLYLFVGLFIQRLVVFPRRMTRHDPGAAARFPDLQIWEIDTEQGRTRAWFLPAVNGGDAATPSPAIIFAYGNADLAQSWAPLLRPYREAGLHVLIPEYRGYGRSDGWPGQKAIVCDFVRFHDRLEAHERVDGDRIVFHGRSLGGGVVCALSLQRRPAALILSSTFTSIGNMAGRFLYPPFLMRDPFDNVRALRAYDGPVLLLHGRRDRITPFHHSRRLQQQAENSELVALPGDHNDMDPYIPGGVAWQHIMSFLDRSGVVSLH